MDLPPIEQVIPGEQPIWFTATTYAGRERVIHYAGWNRGRQGLIEAILLDEFTERREFQVNLTSPDLSGAWLRFFRRSRL